MVTFFGRCGQQGVLLDALANNDMTGSGGPGKKVSFRGKLHSPAPMGAYPSAAQLARVFAERQRLLGLMDNEDEPVVPVNWECEEGVTTGFYRVESVAVNYAGPSAQHGIFDISIEAIQVENFASPQYESIITGAQIANGNGVTGESWFAFPADVTEQMFAADNGLGCDSLSTRPSEDGDIYFTSCHQNFSGILNFFLTPANCYVGSSRILLGRADDPALPRELIVGRQVQTDPMNWEMSNGLVKIESTATTGQFGVSWWSSALADYTTPKTFRIAGTTAPASAGDIATFHNLTILQNSPELCAIRLSCLSSYGGGVTWGRIFIDLFLRNGDRMINGHLTSDRRDDWRIKRDATEAATAVTGGIRATASDGDNIRYVLTSTGPYTTDLTNGAVIADEAITPLDLAPSSFDFGIAAEVPGGTAEQNDTAVRLIRQHYGGQTEKRLIVSR